MKGGEAIVIRGARQNNLAGVDIEIPRNRLTAITGVSGSGKSSLAFDTLFREGQRRFLETLSAYARQFLGRMEKPAVDSVEGLSPAIAVDQKAIQRGPRSTVGISFPVFHEGVVKRPCPRILLDLPAQQQDVFLARHQRPHCAASGHAGRADRLILLADRGDAEKIHHRVDMAGEPEPPPSSALTE